MDELLEVHVGTYPPAEWDLIEERESSWAEGAQRRKRPVIATEQLAWTDLGLRARWVGDDTTQAIAAINASVFHAQGAAELDRFCRGAQQRKELALFIGTIGELDEAGSSGVRHLFGSDASVWFPRVDSFWISGTRIRLATQPSVADGLVGADRDLALRVAQRSLDLPWWSLRRTMQHEGGFFGSWMPLLTTSAGEVVAGVWTEHEDGDAGSALVRHYVLPALATYQPVLQWLAERGIPEFVPGAARRSHRYVTEDSQLQTAQERGLLERLDTLTRNFEEQHATWSAELQAERARAAQVREPLLFGTGEALEVAVARALTDAGLLVTLLDPELGTRSADLLVEHAGRRLLVEVKSSAGRAGESLVDAARKHLRTWPQLSAGVPVDGAVLVVNHQHRLPPGDRSAEVYGRPEFVDSLSDVVVVTTLQIFDWWRDGRWEAIRAALGYDGGSPTAPGGPDEPAQPATAPRRRWRRNR